MSGVYNTAKFIGFRTGRRNPYYRSPLSYCAILIYEARKTMSGEFRLFYHSEISVDRLPHETTNEFHRRGLEEAKAFAKNHDYPYNGYYRQGWELDESMLTYMEMCWVRI